MKGKQGFNSKLSFNSKRLKTEREQNLISQYHMEPIKSQRILPPLLLHQKLQSTLQQQNTRISNLENKYSEALLSRFDKLISINYKIGKNLEKLVRKFEKEQKEEPLHQNQTLPHIPVAATLSAQAPTGWETISPNKTDKQQEKQHGKQQENLKQIEPVNHIPSSTDEQQLDPCGWDKNTLLQVEDNQSLVMVEPILNAIFENHNLAEPKTLTAGPPLKQSTFFTKVFRNMVEYEFSEETLYQSMSRLLGHFYHKTAEFYFVEYSAGRMKYEDMKIKFSSDILNHAIEMCERWIEYVSSQGFQHLKSCNFKKKNLFKIFDKAAVSTLQYLIHKYPPTRSKLIDTELSERIKEIKVFSVIKYDLLRNAGMEFGIKKGQTDFTTDIKLWLNCIIKESKAQFPLFKERMKRIFTNNQGSIDGSKVDVEAEYVICSKISENTQLYTDEEIRAPGIQIKNPSILRILIKWFQQLLSLFTNTQQKIMNNKYGFKSTRHKSIPIKIPYSKSKTLINKLTQIYQKSVKPFIHEQETHIGSIMEGLIGTSVGGIEGYQFLNGREATILKISESFYETLKSYIVIYINGIIQNLTMIREQYSQEESESSINLISFTVSDLLRCSCTGTKPQIYRIYNEILANKEYFQVIRVKNKLNEPTRNILINLKLRESFLICEVQLSLGSIQEQVNDHFCHYLYELQRSKLGVLFECASQIANLDPRISYIKKHKNLRFKQNSILKQKLVSKIRVGDGLYCSSIHPEREMKFITSISPYCCFKCNLYIQGYRFRLPYMQCQECRIAICTECIGAYTKESRLLMRNMVNHPAFNPKAIPPRFFVRNQFVYFGQYSEVQTKRQVLQKLETHDYVLVYGAGNTEIYNLVYKKYKQIVVEAFSTLLQFPESEINMQGGKVLCCMGPLLKAEKRKLGSLQNYMKYHIELSWYQLEEILNNNGIDEVICVVSEESKSVLIVDIEETEMQINECRLKKGIERRIRQVNRFNQNSIEVTSYKAKSAQFLEKVENKGGVVCMNLWENRLADISILSQFVNIQELYLQDNLISSLDPILSLNKLVLLGVGENRVEGALSLLDMPNLQFAIFARNRIDNIQNLVSSNIPNIILLKFSFNPIRSIPSLNFHRLQALTLNNCHINDISRFADSNLPSLLYLLLEQNQISGGLIQFKLPSLIHLNISKNRIDSYGDFVKSDLPKLANLDLQQNQITQALSQWNFPGLKQFNLQGNKIASICEGFLKDKMRSGIQRANISNNRLAGKLPVFHFSYLKILHLHDNEIVDITSLEKSRLQQLQQLTLNNNRIQCRLPELNSKNLRVIDLSFNLIEDILALQRWRCPKLERIKLNNNRISGEIPIMELYNLREIDMSSNNITSEKYISNLHLTPRIQKVRLTDNPPQLKKGIVAQHQFTPPIMLILQL